MPAGFGLSPAVERSDRPEEHLNHFSFHCGISHSHFSSEYSTIHLMLFYRVLKLQTGHGITYDTNCMTDRYSFLKFQSQSF